jgi:hypothetical protein
MRQLLSFYSKRSSILLLNMRINAILLGLSLGVVMSVSTDGSAKTATDQVAKNFDIVDTAAIDRTGNVGSLTKQVTKRGRISHKKMERFILQRRSTPLILPDIVLPKITTQQNSAPQLPALPDYHKTTTTDAPAVQQTPYTYTTTTQNTPQYSVPATTVAPTTVAPTTVEAPPTVAPPTLPLTYYPPYYPQATPQKKKEDDEEEEEEDEEDEEDYDADDLKTRRRR